MSAITANRKPLTRGADTQITQEEARALLMVTFNLFNRWGLKDKQGRILLGQPSTRTYARWKSGEVRGDITFDVSRRLAYLIGIHKALRILYQPAERGYTWIKAPNQIFNGDSALERMLAGDVTDLALVYDYLQAELSG